VETVGLEDKSNQSAGNCHRILRETGSEVLPPLLSVAGVNRARLRSSRHVVLSSELEPDELVTEQLVTRPSGPTSSRKPVVPCCSFRIASCG
jgi:hypothetical protein